MIIERDNRVLLLRRGMTAPWMPGRWNLPGGNVERGETPEQGAIREAEEEAGVIGRVVQAIEPALEFHDGRSQVRVQYFLVEATAERSVLFHGASEQYYAAMLFDGYAENLLNPV